jgi:zinc D-Ala-D-Ala dipeptidase
MKKEDIYNRLEEKMLSYADYQDMPLEPTAEDLVAIPKNGGVVGRQIDKTMYPYTGGTVYVRWSVLQKLREAVKLLKEYSESCQLEVVYGYRAIEVQRQLFEEQKERLKQQYPSEDLMAATHRVIAVPEVAGHPTGGAVDIQIIEHGRPLNMGTEIWEFVPDAFTFSPFVTKEEWANRQLLRRIMTAVGFAPFDGEWWHFSYGDKEWAKYYGERAAIYEQVAFTDHQGGT